MAQEIALGTRVRVQEVTSAGTLRAPYDGTVAGMRKNVLGLGSLEYLVVRTDAGGQFTKFVPAHFVEVRS